MNPRHVVSFLLIALLSGMSITVITVSAVHLIGADRIARGQALLYAACGAATMVSTPFAGMYERNRQQLTTGYQSCNNGIEIALLDGNKRDVDFAAKSKIYRYKIDFTGWLVDLSGNYDVPFWVNGTVSLGACALACASYMTSRHKLYRDVSVTVNKA